MRFAREREIFLCIKDLVTADARLVRASRDENPDLFWGLRGGGNVFRTNRNIRPARRIPARAGAGRREGGGTG